MSSYYDTREGRAPFREYETWYEVAGDLGSAKVPLVVLHGGPGCTHDYLEAFADLAVTGRPVVLYDQLGNGRSTHLPEAPKELWCVETFLEELDGLLRHLGIEQRYNLLGQSWGGMLAAEHAVLKPAGLNALVLADAPASMVTWREEMKRLEGLLPEQVQATLKHYDDIEDYQHPDYQAASRIFYGEHLCRVMPPPEEVQRTIDWIGYDPTVYGTMNGPTEFLVNGTLKNWSIEDRLDRIEVPTLVISGRHDEATPHVVKAYVEGIKGAVERIFEESSHMPHIEEQAACLLTVSAFRHEHDAAGGAVRAG